MDTNNLKQPPSLRIFFATEMWERYGFYVIQTLLALYLTQHFEWEDRPIYDLVASFTAITYLSPIIGGFIADHLLGQKRSILAGILFLFVSYGLLTIVSYLEVVSRSETLYRKALYVRSSHCHS